MTDTNPYAESLIKHTDWLINRLAKEKLTKIFLNGACAVPRCGNRPSVIFIENEGSYQDYQLCEKCYQLVRAAQLTLAGGLVPAQASNENKAECECLNEPMSFDKYNIIRNIGIDETNGRCGEVELWQCKNCGRYWLHYLVEYEAFTGSGRHFMGLITQEIADALSPSEAVEYLNKLDWHLYGGGYFFGKRGKSARRVQADF